jgi:DNA processing protein
LLAAFGSPQAVFDASPAARAAVVGPELAAPLADEPDDLGQRIATAMAWRNAEPMRGLLTLADAEYPALLLQTADPPLLLYVQGRVELLGAPGVAIVGSRNTSPQGRDNARAFAAELSRAGYTIVSGLALGIDGAAHEGGLAGTGSTVAVVGTGLDRIYPPQHRDLAHRIAREGLLVSEFPLGTHPLPGNFPQRNRIIAGLTRGTLVVEAALQSGSLITARLALEAGREVFAMPGSIHAPQSRGCHQLIKQGAKLVDTADDVLQELRPVSGKAAASAVATGLAGDEDPLLRALGYDPTTLDRLVERTGWPAAELNARLLELELDAKVVRLPGGLFQRRAGA